MQCIATWSALTIQLHPDIRPFTIREERGAGMLPVLLVQFRVYQGILILFAFKLAIKISA